MNAFDRYFHAPYRGVRAYVFGKLFLGLVALDTWMLMLGHAGRYGVGEFNVAHFGWLDRALPVPSAGLYVAVLLATGLLALAIALSGNHPVALFALFALYTFSWAMSMLDSYQHHYFVSSVLLCLVFFPRLRVSDLGAAQPAPARDKSKQKPKPRKLTPDDRYALLAGAALALYAGLDFPTHPWLWFLSCFGGLALLTWLRSRQRRGEPARLVSGFGYNLLGATAAILYCFTSIAKMDAQWTAGYTLQRISAAGRVFAPLVEWARAFGISDQSFWAFVSSSVIPLELGVAAGYALAVVQDSSRSRLPRWAALIAFWGALSLHVGAEALNLEIGWFSYYMLLFACCFLLPGPLIETLGQLVIRPAQLLQAQLGDLHDAARERQAETWVAVLGSCGLLGGIAFLIDLPGAPLAATGAALVLIALGVQGLVRKRSASVRSAAIGAGVAATIMWSAISLSSVRWDFYRYLGGDLSRRGETQAALDAFLKGERYAPKGETRRNKIEQLRRKLAQSRHD